MNVVLWGIAHQTRRGKSVSFQKEKHLEKKEKLEKEKVKVKEKVRQRQPGAKTAEADRVQTCLLTCSAGRSTG